MTTLADKIEALAKDATPRPWEVECDTRSEVDRITKADLSYTAGYNISGKGNEVVGCEGILPGPYGEYDTNLIVELVNNLPAILRALRERDQAVEALRVIAEVDDDGWTSDGHERCTEWAERTLASIEGAGHE